MTRFLLAILLCLFAGAAAAQTLNGSRYEMVRLAGAPGSRIAATLDFNADNVSGNGGCNRYSGPYRRSGLRRIRFGSIVSTRMYCGPASEFESRYFAALARTRSFRVNGERLILLSGGRRPRVLAVLQRVD